MPYLDDIFPEDTANAVRRQIDAQVDEQVRAIIFPYRLRFYGILIALVIGMTIGITGYTHTLSEFDRHDAIQANRVCLAVQGNYDSIRLLIIRATPTEPRAVQQDGKTLKYTKSQIEEILAYRRYLLHGLHEPPPCISRANKGNAAP